MKSPGIRYKKGIKTVDDYIQSFPKGVASKLKTNRKIVKAEAPQAEEGISYHVPAYTLCGMLLSFGAYPNHIAIYPYPSATKTFQKELTHYKTGKGTIRFSLDKPLPILLIRKIVAFE